MKRRSMKAPLIISLIVAIIFSACVPMGNASAASLHKWACPSTYYVVAGDDIAKIAAASGLGITYYDMMRANNMTNPAIYVGQKLTVPCPATATPTPNGTPARTPTPIPQFIPPALPVPTPTAYTVVSYQYDPYYDLQVWNFTSRKIDSGVLLAGMVTTWSPLIALPPWAVVLGIVILGGTALYVLAAPAINTAAWNNIVVFAQQKQVNMPVPVPGIPPIPEHLARDHDAYTGMLKVAVWVTIFNALLNGKPPICGQRASDGVWIIVFLAETVSKSTGGLYKGLGAILNPANRTTIWGVKMENNAFTSSNAAEFIIKPCPGNSDILKFASP